MEIPGLLAGSFQRYDRAYNSNAALKASTLPAMCFMSRTNSPVCDSLDVLFMIRLQGSVVCGVINMEPQLVFDSSLRVMSSPRHFYSVAKNAVMIP